MRNPFRKEQSEDLTLESLSLAVNNLTQQRKALNEKTKRLQAAYDSKKAANRLKAELETMTDAQKKALVQEIEAQGIASEEAFGVP